MDFLKDLSIDKVRNLAEDAFNQAKPKTDVEARVYEVLSHKNWGSSSSLMHEIARDTFDIERFHVVTRLMWEGMENQRPAAWRIVFKALTLLEFLVKNGAERCVDDARNHGHVLRALGQFNYYEGTIDRGLGVREKSKQIMEVLADDERIREERQKARKLRQKFGSGAAAASSSAGGQNAGYGNQESWNSGGGYGQGGVDSSPYESGGGYSGRYAGSRGGDNVPVASTPTFASIPDGKNKKLKKKKKKPEGELETPAPAPAPEIDLFSFDNPSPAPAPPASSANVDFGAFQTTTAPPPAVDDDFGAFVASKASQPDPFAAPVSQNPAATTFNAFGNSAALPQTNVMGGNMQNVTNSFGNMSMGQPQPVQAPSVGDDEFGDFADAAPKAPAVVNLNSSDPFSKLVSLDGLSKNPKSNPTNQVTNQNVGFGGMGGVGMGGMNTTQTMAMHNNMPLTSGVVSAGGGDAISSLFAPTPVGMPQAMGVQTPVVQHQQGMMNPQMMQQTGMQQMNPQMMQQTGMQQMSPHMMVNPMGGMHGGNMMAGNMQSGMQQGNMMGNLNPNMMGNQMGGTQGNMMGGQQMGVMQGMGGIQGNMMGGQMMGGMQGNMMGGQPVNGMQGNMMGGQMMGGMQGNMQGNMMGGPQWR